MTMSGADRRCADQFGKISAALPSRPTDLASPAFVQRVDHRQRLVERLGLLVDIAGAQAEIDAGLDRIRRPGSRRRP